MIVPVSPGGRDEADLWAGLYNSEDSWLDWALRPSPAAGVPEGIRTLTQAS